MPLVTTLLMPAAAKPITFAHNGGLDEFLLVAAPLLIIAALLWVANRRAARLEETESDES